MKNTQIKNLKEVVPKEIRLQVYKDALEYYGSLLEAPKKWGTGLCLVLPCALWGFSDYIAEESMDLKWDFENTPIAFPELNNDVLLDLKSINLEDNSRMQIRCTYLKIWISDLEKS
jgi:hypothetical protein